MRVLLYRFAEFGDEGTAGHLEVEGWRAAILELPWRDNRRNVSRLPSGLYALELDAELPTYYLIGETCSRYPEPGVARSACRFDVANFARQLRGCLAIGTAHGFLEGSRELAVLRSRVARDQLLELLAWDRENELLIEDRFGGYAYES